MTTATPRNWLVTGGSRGLGRAFTEAALDAGDRVATISRTTEPLEQLRAAHQGRLFTHAADVTDRAAVFATVTDAVAQLGRLDIVVNNAGTMSMGMVEEFTEAEARAAMETNFFGALWVSQAVSLVLREQRGGHLVQVSSVGALVTGPSAGLYSASKFALEGMSEALAAELASFGARLTMVEPGGYWTDLFAAMHATTEHPGYAALRADLAAQWGEGSVDSDPRLAAEALLKLVASENPPLRLVLGSAVYDAAADACRERLATWSQWEEVSRAAEHAISAPPR